MMGSDYSLNSYLRIGEAADVARLSTRTIRRAMAAATHPLRHYRVGRRVVIARSDLVSWLEMHRVAPEIAIPANGAVTELLNRLNRTPGAPAAGKS